MVKICTKCNIEQDISQFSISNKSKDGHKTICKDCCKKQNAKYRQEHLEQHKEYMRNYNAEHKEKSKEYYEQHKEIIQEQYRKYYNEHLKEMQEYRNRSKDRVKEYNRKYHNEIIEKECANPKCKKLFKAPRSGTKYCSDACYKETYLASCRKTNQEKYGVDYYVLTEDYRSRGIDKVSKTNKNFGKLLQNYGIRYIMEFILENYSYDFYLPEYNLLIEINPTFTHSVMDNILGWSVEKDYHYNKTILAKQNGYNCICIWDWDDKEAIVRAIKENTLKILNGTIINKHWNKVNTKEHKQDNGQDEQQMIVEGWLPIYDDGQTLIY